MVFACVLALGTLSSDAVAAQYERALQDKIITEGLGFEGVLTIYDETPRMFRTLGRNPIRSTKNSLVYTYNDAGFRIVVTADYAAGRFVIRRIRYAADPQRRIRTDRGVRLQDSVARLQDEYGIAARGAQGEWIYGSRGISFGVDEAGRVTSIAVFRPDPQEKKSSQKGTWPNAGKPVSKLSKSPNRRVYSTGMTWAPNADWRVLEDGPDQGFSAVTNDGEIFVRVVSCVRCFPALQRTKSLLAKGTRWRPSPPDRKPMAKDWLREIGADSGSIDVYPQFLGTRTAWLISLKRDRTWTQTLVTTGPIHGLTGEVQRRLVELFKALRMKLPGS